MATQYEIQATYDYLDEFWRATFGDNADITAALFDGDLDKSLEQAQVDKHTHILQSLGFKRGGRLLDIGCGWGGLLQRVATEGGKGVGFTLSPKQADACAREGLDVRLCDWKQVVPHDLGRFDYIACVGAFEHFCSEKEYVEGRQEAIYRSFFELCDALLVSRGTLYLQTMLWGDLVPRQTDISVHAKWGTNEKILGLLRNFYPGSWLPLNMEQIATTAAPSLVIESTKNGRLDYIHTITQWGRRARSLRASQLLAAIRLTPLLKNKDFIYRLQSMLIGCNRECFKRRLMDHERILLRKSL